MNQEERDQEIGERLADLRVWDPSGGGGEGCWVWSDEVDDEVGKGMMFSAGTFGVTGKVGDRNGMGTSQGRDIDLGYGMR